MSTIGLFLAQYATSTSVILKIDTSRIDVSRRESTVCNLKHFDKVNYIHADKKPKKHTVPDTKD